MSKRLREDINDLEWHPDVQAAEAAQRFAAAEPDAQTEMAMVIARRIVSVVQPKRGGHGSDTQKIARGVQCRTCALIYLTCPEMMGWRSQSAVAEYLGISPQTFHVHLEEVRRYIANGVDMSDIDEQGMVHKDGK